MRTQEILSLWNFLGSERVLTIILFPCTIEFLRHFGRRYFLTETHAGSCTGSVTFFGTSQGGLHLQ